MNHPLLVTKKNNLIKCLFLSMAIFSITNVFSQSTSLGIRAGANLSNWNFSIAGVDSRSMLNPDAGVFAVFLISKTFSLEPGVTYSILGSELNYGEDEKIEYKLSYLQVPIMGKYVFANGVGFFAGPQVAFLLDAKSKENKGANQDIKSVLNKTDFFIALGMEYNFPAGISIYVKYNAGLMNIYKQEGGVIKNYSFGLGVAYQFHFAEK